MPSPEATTVDVTWTSTTSSRGADLTVMENEVRNLTGSVSYDKIRIMSNGVLNVVKGATVNTELVESKGGSIIVAGTLKVYNHVAAGECDIGGICQIHGWGPYLKVESGGKIQVIGPESTDNIMQSQGGRAIVDFMAEDYIEVFGEISVAGSTGASADVPWVSGGLIGHVSSGGSSDIILKTKMREGSYIKVTGKLIATGGTGGNAADADGSASGGFSDGGVVEGNIGAGGDVNITVSGYKVDITNVLKER